MAFAMCYTTYNKKQFIEALTQALSRREDTHITMGENGAVHRINGIATVEREIVEETKWLETHFKDWRTWDELTPKQQAFKLEIHLRPLRKRLDNPQSIINRFKRTPASMWVA